MMADVKLFTDAESTSTERDVERWASQGGDAPAQVHAPLFIRFSTDTQVSSTLHPSLSGFGLVLGAAFAAHMSAAPSYLVARNSLGSSPSHEQPSQTALRSTVLSAAREALPQLRTEVRSQAEACLGTIEQCLSVHAFDVGAPAIVLADDGALLLEWTRGQRRVGMNVEVNPRDSGWYFVSLDADAPGSASGSMRDLDAAYLFERLTG